MTLRKRIVNAANVISYVFLCLSAQAGQHDVNRRASLNSETSGNKQTDKSNEKAMCRTKVTQELTQVVNSKKKNSKVAN